jgi:hypothetical protein
MPPPPDIVALARRRYADGVPVTAIIAETKLSHGMLYACLDGTIDPAAGLPRIPRRNATLGRRRRAPKAARVSLVNRLWSAAERQAYDIEQRLIAEKQAPDERERDARVLAVLVKTLRELAAFDAEHGETDVNEADDEFPRDADELRRDLARRIAGLRETYAADPGGAASS